MQITNPHRKKQALDRVQLHLNSEPFFKKYLIGRKITVRDRRGRISRYHRFVLWITDRLASHGIDAAFCQKEVLLAGVIALDGYMLADRH